MYSFSTPQRARTSNLRFRRPMLYPIELGVLRGFTVATKNRLHRCQRITSRRRLGKSYPMFIDAQSRKILALVLVGLPFLTRGTARAEHPLTYVYSSDDGITRRAVRTHVIGGCEGSPVRSLTFSAPILNQKHMVGFGRNC